MRVRQKVPQKPDRLMRRFAAFQVRVKGWGKSPPVVRQRAMMVNLTRSKIKQCCSVALPTFVRFSTDNSTGRLLYTEWW